MQMGRMSKAPTGYYSTVAFVYAWYLFDVKGKPLHVRTIAGGWATLLMAHTYYYYYYYYISNFPYITEPFTNTE
jgi:hypothetical protein